LLAPSILQPDDSSPKGGNVRLGTCEEPGSSIENPLNLSSSEELNFSSFDEYAQLQRRIFMATLIVSAFAVLITAIFFDFISSVSLLVGALAGVVYLRLLARSIGKLGKTSKSVGKVQLVVPVLLVLVVSRLPQLELLPSLLGFLMYKPALILQVMLEP